MDEFQYIILSKEWAKLLTKASKKRFILKTYAKFAPMDMEEDYFNTTPQLQRLTGFLWEIVNEVPADLLPKYIPATLHYRLGRF